MGAFSSQIKNNPTVLLIIRSHHQLLKQIKITRRDKCCVYALVLSLGSGPTVFKNNVTLHK